MLCEECRRKIKVPDTLRQKEILDYYEDFLRRRGFTPSYTQIARHIGVTSKTTISKHVRALRAQGFQIISRRMSDARK